MHITRNQYLFIEKGQSELSFFNSFTIGDFMLYCGEDCRCIIEQESDKFIVLIGYAIDTSRPFISESELCKSFRNSIDRGVPVEQITYTWNGRWVVIYNDSDEIFAINDACGLKQLFYTTTDCVAIASQARYIAKVLHLSLDDEATTFIKIEQKNNKEFSIPVNTTSFAKVKRLLPNHFYSSENKLASRMQIGGWLSFLDIPSISRRMEGGVEGICTRFKDVAETLTAGLDSRLVLAHSKSSLEVIHFVTFRYMGMPESHIDLIIPSILKDRLGLRHSVIQCFENELFAKKYKTASEIYHEYWIQMTHAVEQLGYDYPLLIKGSCCEITRNPFGLIPNKYITSELLCKLFQITPSKFSISAINSWIEEALPFCNSNKLLLSDLFYWEQRMGSWLATCFNESDIVCDTFTPFNTREILWNLLSINRKERISPKYKVFKKILSNKLPLIEDIPVNPGRNSSLLARFKCLIKNNCPLVYIKII